MFALIFLSKGEICKSIPDYLIYAMQEEEMVSNANRDLPPTIFKKKIIHHKT